jgi:hypothetical protein
MGRNVGCGAVANRQSVSMATATESTGLKTNEEGMESVWKVRRQYDRRWEQFL